MVGVGTVQGDVDGGDVVVGVGHMTMASILHMTQATSSRQIWSHNIFITVVSSLGSLVWK